MRESIQLLREMGKRLVFVTNNSNKSRRQYVHKFEKLGIFVEKEEVFSAAFAAAYLKTQKFAKKAMVIGGQGIVDELNEMYLEVDPGVFNAVQCTEMDWEELDIDPDCGAVIVGQDTSFTYAKLAYASLAIQRGAVFVATNPDAGDAIGPGLMPGAGAIVASVEKASGVSPEIYAGKPSAFLLELLKGNHVDMARTLVVGDRLDTDIAFGRAGGAGATVLTLSGVCGLEDVDAAMEEGGDIPDHIVQSLPLCSGSTRRMRRRLSLSRTTRRTIARGTTPPAGTTWTITWTMRSSRTMTTCCSTRWTTRRRGAEFRRTHLARQTDVVVTSACATELLFLTSLARSAPILRAASLLRRSSPRRGTRNTACTNVPPGVAPGSAGRSANPVERHPRVLRGSRHRALVAIRRELDPEEITAGRRTRGSLPPVDDSSLDAAS